MTEQAVHVFEKAGLGLAPFRCVGLFSLPSQSLLESNPTAYNNAMAEMPRGLGCGSCKFCGTGIMHNFIIESRDAKRFVVGSDCVAKTGDAGLRKQTRAARLTVVREQRATRRQMARAEREAIWAAERAARAEEFKVQYAALIERAKPYMAGNRFIDDVMTSHLEGRFVSEKALEAVGRSIDEAVARAARKANSKHVGVVGKRQAFGQVTVVRKASYERPCFQRQGYETVWVISMSDVDGNTLLVKSPSFYAEKGETFKIKATVKEHSEYDGERQTVVQRVAKVV